jgi:3-hydroxymyristoyl/3-hydroxydecanoyl-(acyl carrier protein) dehydratase
MRFTDTIFLSADKRTAEARLFVAPDAEFLRDHFPENPMLPGLLMLEAAVRAASQLWRARCAGNCAEKDLNATLSALGNQPFESSLTEFARLARVERLSVARRVVPKEILKVQVEFIADEAQSDKTVNGNNPMALFAARASVNDENAMRARFLLRREMTA